MKIIIYSLLCLVVAYFLSILIRSVTLYSDFKTESREWKGNIMQPDELLGYKPAPNSFGFQKTPVGEGTPVHFDELGFRVPLEYIFSGNFRPLILSLGCSFTFGDACLAEETFSYLIAKELNGTVHNAGVSGYGLAQMLSRAREFIPKYQPDYVVVQYSPWLAVRASKMYAPVQYFYVPTPYFAVVNDSIQIISPPFTVLVRGNSFSEKQIPDYFTFFKEICLPMMPYYDYHVTVTRMKLFFGLIPEPLEDYQQIETFAFDDLLRICEKHGAKMILLVISNELNANKITQAGRGESITIANADYALYQNLTIKTQEEYNRVYGLWKGNPPILVDRHPNPVSHQIISGEILKAIEKLNSENN
ncbi:MAG: hypothetical protein COA57_06410 [Flavobacteriales bacterium]|nr:SGNH/GDSL hydrolase family protein [Bacteroidales bacterium AH-315-I05]PCJ86353.1 MAG: hypothetical protein COA57_06410 [Flavobacteriales bacterium]